MQWTYEVRGETPHENSPPVGGSSCVVRPANERQRNFVIRNRRVPSLANLSPLKVQR